MRVRTLRDLNFWIKSKKNLGLNISYIAQKLSFCIKYRILRFDTSTSCSIKTSLKINLVDRVAKMHFTDTVIK